jgi:hypothetical protein
MSENRRVVRRRYFEKLVTVSMQINPETEPNVAARILELKRKKKVTAFLKDALENYKVDEV